MTPYTNSWLQRFVIYRIKEEEGATLLTKAYAALRAALKNEEEFIRITENLITSGYEEIATKCWDNLL